MRLFLDFVSLPSSIAISDRREITSCYRNDEQWKTVRTYEAFVRAVSELKPGEMFDVVSFDHDLHSSHSNYSPVLSMAGNIWVNEEPFIDIYKSMKVKCGYHCAVFLVEYCLEHRLSMPLCFVHEKYKKGDVILWALSQYEVKLEQEMERSFEQCGC